MACNFIHHWPDERAHTWLPTDSIHSSKRVENLNVSSHFTHFNSLIWLVTCWTVLRRLQWDFNFRVLLILCLVTIVAVIRVIVTLIGDGSRRSIWRHHVGHWVTTWIRITAYICVWIIVGIVYVEFFHLVILLHILLAALCRVNELFTNHFHFWWQLRLERIYAVFHGENVWKLWWFL